MGDDHAIGLALDARTNLSFTWNLEPCSVHAFSDRKLNDHHDFSSTATLFPFHESTEISPTRKIIAKKASMPRHTQVPGVRRNPITGVLRI